jgi:Reverse transcriptase (RNA-dependent DNA polymerase)
MSVFNWDFTSGYHHVAINPIRSKYLGFSFHWPNGVQRFFEFTQLPFGLSSACYIFTKLTRPLIKYWRAHGLNVFIYIDDGLSVCSSRAQALRASAQVRLDLKQAGFVVSEKNSHWDPAGRIQWLGFVVDSDRI